jgi:hypothetical protein
MAVVTIRPTSAVADVTLDGDSYKDFMSYASVIANAPRLDETVFSTENAGGESSIGTTELTIQLRGIMRRGADNAGPLIPLPENIAFVVAWDTGCQISGTCNFTQAGGYRAAGATGTIDGTAFSTGAFVKSWNTSS